MIEQLLTIDDVARLLAVHRRTVERLLQRGELVSVSFGQAVRIDPADLRELIERQKTTPARFRARRGNQVSPVRQTPASFADRLRSLERERAAG